MERTSPAEAGEEGLVEDFSSTGCCGTPSSLRFWLVSQGSPGSQLSRTPTAAPPLRPGPSPRALPVDRCSLLSSQGPQTPVQPLPFFSPEPRSGSPPTLLLVPVLVPIAAVTKCHKHSGLRQHSVFSCSSGGQKSKMHPNGLKIKVMTGLPSFQRLQGKLLLCLYHLLGAAYLPTQC